MRTFEITVQGKQYTGQTASAVAQEEMLGIVGQCGITGILDPSSDISEMSKVSYIMTVPKNLRDRIADLCIKGSGRNTDLVKTEDGVPVALNLFTDNIQGWPLLLVEVLRENLSGFFTLNGLGESAPAEADQTER